MTKILAWITDIAVSAVVAFVIVSIVNAIINLGIEMSWFGSWSDGISMLWSEIIIPATILLAIFFAVNHAPQR